MLTFDILRAASSFRRLSSLQKQSGTVRDSVLAINTVWKISSISGLKARNKSVGRRIPGVYQSKLRILAAESIFILKPRTANDISASALWHPGSPLRYD